jgi:Mrp family chromosome partitioning ATPase
MGRMLEALTQPRGKRCPKEPEERPSLPPPPAEDAAAEEEAPMPFIEVGGPRAAVEGSPDVMASAAPKPIVPEAKAVSAKVEPPVAAAQKPGAWTVQLHPWAASPPAPRPIAAELIAFHQPEHAVSVQYRALLNGLLAQLPAGRGQVVLLTSPAPWAGTTTVLLNLAVTAARQEARRVAVVDANLRRPALAERLGVASSPGLRDVLAGTATLALALQETSQANLRVVPAGQVTSGETRLPFDWLLPTLRQLREQFDLVFVDAPSWNEGSEVAALAATCDAVYMVLHQPGRTSGEGATAVPLLRQPPNNLQGCILTMR